MKLDTPYKLLDLQANPELLNFDFSLITEEDWDKVQILKKIFKEFAEVKPFKILSIEIPEWKDPFNAKPPALSNTNNPVHSHIMAEVRKLEKHYNATAKIAVLDGLPPGAKIDQHSDLDYLYQVCHRVHLPIVTAPDVKFYIDGVPYHFKAGEFFEFDNQRPHHVRNDSDIFRIHLVVDLLPNNIFPN